VGQILPEGGAITWSVRVSTERKKKASPTWGADLFLPKTRKQEGFTGETLSTGGLVSRRKKNLPKDSLDPPFSKKRRETP